MPDQIPEFWQKLLHSYAQKALTGAAAALTTYGVIQPDQQTQVVAIGLSAAAWAASFAWTYIRDHSQHQREAALAAQAK